MIKFENVTKSYSDGTTAVDHINLEINQGEFFVIIGPSGSGKTTTLKMMNRLIPLSDGTIYFRDKRISDYAIHELRWNMGYVLQQIALFPHMTIAENIAIVPELKKWDEEKINKRVDELLAMVGLDPTTYRDRKPTELSGGEQQRVGVIRALAAEPEIVLMDEPFSALDPISREKLQDDIIKLQQNIKKTIVFVTHDMSEALKLADRICVMKDGNIVQIGSPQELIQNPINTFVESFVGGGSLSSLEGISLEEFIQPLEMSKFSQPVTNSLSITSTIEELFKALSSTEEIVVEQNGEVIGFVSRQKVMELLAGHLQKRGNANE